MISRLAKFVQAIKRNRKSCKYEHRRGSQPPAFPQYLAMVLTGWVQCLFINRLRLIDTLMSLTLESSDINVGCSYLANSICECTERYGSQTKHEIWEFIPVDDLYIVFLCNDYTPYRLTKRCYESRNYCSKICLASKELLQVPIIARCDWNNLI